MAMLLASMTATSALAVTGEFDAGTDEVIEVLGSISGEYTNGSGVVSIFTIVEVSEGVWEENSNPISQSLVQSYLDGTETYGGAIDNVTGSMGVTYQAAVAVSGTGDFGEVADSINNNADAIADNTTTIGDNADAIADNTAAIGDNTTAIGESILQWTDLGGRVWTQTAPGGDFSSPAGGGFTDSVTAAYVIDQVTNSSNGNLVVIGSTGLTGAVNDNFNALALLQGRTTALEVTAADHETRITDNTADIATNVTAIEANATDIATNVTDIATIAADLITERDARLAAAITAAALDLAARDAIEADVTANTTSVADNAADITALETVVGTRIDDNATAIAANVTAIADNVTAIGVVAQDLVDAKVALQASIDFNASGIAQNVSDIITNAAIVTQLEVDLKLLITANADAIVVERLARVAADEALQTALDTEATTRQQADAIHTAAIAANVADIVQNAADIVTETQARVTADAILSGRIDVNSARLDGHDVILADHEGRIASLEALHVSVDDGGRSVSVRLDDGRMMMMHFNADGSMIGQPRMLTFMDNPVFHMPGSVMWNDEGVMVDANTREPVDANGNAIIEVTEAEELNRIEMESIQFGR